MVNFSLPSIRDAPVFVGVREILSGEVTGFDSQRKRLDGFIKVPALVGRDSSIEMSTPLRCADKGKITTMPMKTRS